MCNLLGRVCLIQIKMQSHNSGLFFLLCMHNLDQSRSQSMTSFFAGGVVILLRTFSDFHLSAVFMYILYSNVMYGKLVPAILDN